MPDAVALTPIPTGALSLKKNFLQSGFWAEFRASCGWSPLAVEWSSGTDKGRMLVLLRRFKGQLSMAYVPHGPDLPSKTTPREKTHLLAAMGEALKRHLPSRCLMVRFDLMGGTRGSLKAGIPRPEPLCVPLHSAPVTIQPPDTLILDIRADEETLMAGMHKKTRYNIRLAERKNVRVRRYDGSEVLDTLSGWYQIYRETARRDRISIRSEQYYRTLIEKSLTYEESPQISLYMAEHEGDTLAGIITLGAEKRTTYLYGASLSRKRELMPNYLLQWRAVQDAHREGMEEYDLYGIPPAEDPSHSMHGLWRFKRGFGGDIFHYMGPWDYPFRPMVYKMFRTAEKFRNAWG